MPASAERNLRLYPVYQSLRGAMFWLPIFFLYFTSVLSMADALLLEAFYYFAVVLLEVPSGYFSDRAGRRPTLLIANACGIASTLLFATTASFAWFAAAQVLMAAMVALNSGSDSSLLYDSLRELGREDEIGLHESRGTSRGLAATAVAAAVGGLAAGVDLRLAWVLSAVASAGTFAAAWAFAEPRLATEQTLAPVRALLGRMRDPVLRWIGVYVVGMVVLNHVPYEFYQPYLDLLLGQTGVGGDYAVTPAASGAVTAVMMALGAVASARAMQIRERLGVVPSLLLATAVQLTIIAAMAGWLSPWIVVLVALRSVPMGLLAPIASAAIHPRVPTEIRATYLSVQSLAGRLAFAACLAISSNALAGDSGTHVEIAQVLNAFALGGTGLWIGLALTSTAVRRTGRPPNTPNQGAENA